MGEIDDNYKERIESVDQEFLDGLKGTKKGVVEKYKKGLNASRKTLVDKYKKENAQKLKKIWGVKPKRVKKEKFKHLEIKHFDFEFNRYEKFKMWGNLFWFKLVRKWRVGGNSVPSWMMYTYYKVVKSVKYTFRDIMEVKERAWKSVVKISLRFWKQMKEIYAIIKKEFIVVKAVILPKIMFWKKKGEGDRAGEKKEGGVRRNL